jgi:hypothetical protein
MKKAQKAGKHQKECRKQRQEITAGARGNNKPKGMQNQSKKPTVKKKREATFKENKQKAVQAAT